MGVSRQDLSDLQCCFCVKEGDCATLRLREDKHFKRNLHQQKKRPAHRGPFNVQSGWRRSILVGLKEGAQGLDLRRRGLCQQRNDVEDVLAFRQNGEQFQGIIGI